MATSWVAKNDYLTTAEMQNNAEMLLKTLYNMGFTFNAICAIAGNMQAESGINPGIWESLDPYVGGYGLVQWTPYTKYSDWAGADWQNNGQKQCERIKYEFDNNIQWSTDYEYAVNMTATQFRNSLASPEVLAVAFLWNYENPYVASAQAKLEKEQERSANARAWWNYLYSPRLTMGNIYSSPYYTTWDAYYPRYRMPNCTCYAFGRWNELTDTREFHYRFPTGNGCDWYPQGIAKGFSGGMLPELGSAACWWYTDSHGDPSGHVAIVEQINFDSNGNPTSFVTSNSAWYRSDPDDDYSDIGTVREEFPYFYLETIDMNDLDDRGSGHPEAYFQGFLYLNNINPTPIPPTPPTPTPTGKQMSFMYYLKRLI